MLSFEAAVAAAAVTIPLMLIAAYLDLKYLILPNWLTLTMLVAFVLIAGGDALLNSDNTAMTLGNMGWRLLAGAITLVAGFMLFSLGAVGGGDVKLLAVSVPFFAPIDLDNVLLIYCFSALLGFGAIWLIEFSGIGPRSGWKAWSQRDRKGKPTYPWGIALAMTMIVYHLAVLALRWPQNIGELQ